jgi:hypothetical protein
MYQVYPAPSYWVTDWMIGSYMADRYDAMVSLEQAREEARLAREDAARAREAAERARDEAEIAEARAAAASAEACAVKAEARAAKAEAAQARGDQPNPNATPIDEPTKEALRTQIEQTVADYKQGVKPDLAAALRDPKHIYPVAGSLSVTSPDGTPAGTLTEGDLLRLEPGQEETLRDATETTIVNMRVITSKGEEDGVRAGTVVSVSLKSLQDFDSEFRAKLDVGLQEAEKNKDQFRVPAQ